MWASLALALWWPAPPGQARFLIEDADQVDQEERYASETYNDKLSYRWPAAWEDLWDGADVGWRTHAGSLNISKFDYAEDLKIWANRDQDVDAAFFLTRREDVLERRTEREVRISGRMAGPWWLGIVGDGGSRKEFGDVGMFTAWAESRRRRVELHLWSVDHFYATKKSEAGDNRPRSAATAALNLDWLFDSGPRLRLKAEHDRPVVWNRASEGYRYELLRGTAALRLDGPVEGGRWQWNLGAAFERKDEGKDWRLGPAPVTFAKSLRRRVATVEAGTVARSDGVEWSGGLLALRRRAEYQYVADPALADGQLPEPRAIESSSRDEVAVWAQRYAPWSGMGERHHAVLGSQINHVGLDENGRRRWLELKGQTAWEFRLTPGARILTNVTWDIDEIGRAAPPASKPFRPWGGGDLQIIAVF